ncbi:MAG: amidohydrolase [Candidatus Thorarchaeota archaeon]|nr:amidohydrolase [Candidatus Thorarchaeota archaeon]
MLIVRAIDDQPSRGIKKGDEFWLYIVDAHHHMGREKGHTNTPAGAYEFYAQLWFEMQKIAKNLRDEDALLFEPIAVAPSDFANRCFNSHKSWERLNHGWLVDRTIVFPYTDDYSKPETAKAPSFKVSNDKIAGWTTRAPHSIRMIGFARVNPMDGTRQKDLAVKELERSVQVLGLRGLKLHPLAQLFLDSIEGELTKNIVKRAGELNIPVIFDTRNINTVLRIKTLVESIKNDPECGTAIRGLRVVLAHCGMSPGDPQLFDALRDPAIFAETSTLHDLDVPVLFESAVERLGRLNSPWSEKILFGTDFSFLSVQAADIILYLLSRKFPGTLADIQRILGGNALMLAQKPFATETGRSATPVVYDCLDQDKSNQHQLENSIISLINQEDWDLCSLDVMLPPEGTWPEPLPVSRGGFNGVYLDSYVMTLRTKNNDREIHLWMRRGPNSLLSCSLLSTSGMTRIETIQNASQLNNSVLIRSLRDHAVTLETGKNLHEKVVSYFR